MVLGLRLGILWIFLVLTDQRNRAPPMLAGKEDIKPRLAFLVHAQAMVYLLPSEDAVVVRLDPQHTFGGHLVGNRNAERAILLWSARIDARVRRPGTYLAQLQVPLPFLDASCDLRGGHLQSAIPRVPARVLFRAVPVGIAPQVPVEVAGIPAHRKRLRIAPVERPEPFPLMRDIEIRNPVDLAVQLGKCLSLERIPDAVPQPHPLKFGELPQSRQVLAVVCQRRVILQRRRDETTAYPYLSACAVVHVLVDRRAGRDGPDAETVLDELMAYPAGIRRAANRAADFGVRGTHPRENVKILRRRELCYFVRIDPMIFLPLIVILIILVLHVAELDDRATWPMPPLLRGRPRRVRIDKWIILVCPVEQFL